MIQSRTKEVDIQSALTPVTVFKPYLFEGGRDGKSIFKVMRVSQGIAQESVEKLFEKLPIEFRLARNLENFEDLNEPLEVYVEGPIVLIYPPKNRVLACTSLDSWQSAKTVSRMKVDNLADMISPGRGQIRSCIHFFPSILGIGHWPNAETNEMEIDIHVFPRGKENEPPYKPDILGRRDVKDLLDLIAGGDRRLTVEQLDSWRDLIMLAVNTMRSRYERPEADQNSQRYYKQCWEAIDAAVGNDEGMVLALLQLRSAIHWK